MTSEYNVTAPAKDPVALGRRFNTPAIIMHWMIAALMATVIGLALYMDDLPAGTEKYQIYMLHKSFGMMVLAVALPRIAWRFIGTHPGKIPTHRRWEKNLSNATAYGLYALMLAMPVSGLLMNSAAGYPLNLFGAVTIPPVIDKNVELGKMIKEFHEIGGTVIQVLIVLHVGGALKHLVIDRDNTLYRMLPFKFLKFR